MPLPLQKLAFSPQGGEFLVAVGRCAAGEGSCLTLWSTGSGGCGAAAAGEAELVASVDLAAAEAVAGLAWLPGVGRATFYTASSQGLTQWQLEAAALVRTAVHLPAPLRDRGLTAVAAACRQVQQQPQLGCGNAAASRWWQPREPPSQTVIVGDGSGGVWRLCIDGGQDCCSFHVLARLEGQPVSALLAAGRHLAVGTAIGGLVLLGEQPCSRKQGCCWQQRYGEAPPPTSWRMLSREQLDGAVLEVQLDKAAAAAGGAVAVEASTASGTLWRLATANAGSAQLQQPQMLLCGQRRAATDWCFVPQAASWKGLPPTAAVASSAGVAVRQLVRGALGALLAAF